MDYQMLITVVSYLINIPIVLLALSAHECAHGYAAYKMGDRTAKNLGRLTLNPFKHLDLMGALCMVLFRFGWAKPVPVNARNFRNPKWGMAITALAGPLTNFLMSFLGALLYRIAAVLLFPVMQGTTVGTTTYWLVMLVLTFLQMFAILNLSLAIFNLIPIPPFDGSRIAFVLLPDKWYFRIMKYEQYLMIALLVLLAVSRYAGWPSPISTVVDWVLRGFDWLFDLIPFLR